MPSFLIDIANKWLNIVTFGAIDYVMDRFIAGPLGSSGVVGAYAASGLGFQAKLSAAELNPLGGLRGSMMN